MGAFAIFTAMEARSKRFVIGMVVVHTLLLALYTFPSQLVPEQLRVIGQFYARPLFHQQWRLFAPDPPQCDCGIEVKVGHEDWRSIARQGDGYLDRRMEQSTARNVQRAMAPGVAPDAPTSQAVRALVRDIGREQSTLRFRLVERCVLLANEPGQREERITEIELP